MNRIYQTHFGFEATSEQRIGNCMQAVFASLYGLSLDDVPHFIEHKNWQNVLFNFLRGRGYKFKKMVNNSRIGVFPYTDYEETFLDDIFPDIVKGDGINGLFYALVYSPAHINIELLRTDASYVPALHAVVVDREFNIVHDPNPEYRGLKEYPLAKEIGYNGVCYMNIINKM